jgi:hypothetical protein
VRADDESTPATTHVKAGELPSYWFGLGRTLASGVLSIDDPRGRRDVIVMRRGSVVVALATTHLAGVRLARLVNTNHNSELNIEFDGGTIAYPPGHRVQQLDLAGWVRQHLEAQVDGVLADRLTRQFAGTRLLLRPEALRGCNLDEADRRMVAAMAIPRRLDQIWPLARTPRFRLLAFLHFANNVGALDHSGVVTERSAPHQIAHAPQRLHAARTLGVAETADASTIKRAYHRLVRAVHPDLQPLVPAHVRAQLEAQLRTLTVAYQQLHVR